MYKIGIIGDRESVMGYLALGFSVHEADDSKMAAKLLHSLVKENTYAIIFITEDYASEIQEEIDKYKNNPMPAVICVPGKGGSLGYGMENVRNSVTRAIGADILFGNDKKQNG